MSKSDPSDLSRINMTDNSDMIANKIRKAKTDQFGLPSEPKAWKAERRQKTWYRYTQHLEMIVLKTC